MAEYYGERVGAWWKSQLASFSGSTPQLFSQATKTGAEGGNKARSKQIQNLSVKKTEEYV